MMDNIIVHKFSNDFAYAIEGILQGLCDFSYTSIYLIWGISFVFHIISLRSWFGNRAKNEALLEMIQSLQTNNKQLVEKVILCRGIASIWQTKSSQCQRVLRHYLKEFVLLNLIIEIC